MHMGFVGTMRYPTTISSTSSQSSSLTIFSSRCRRFGNAGIVVVGIVVVGIVVVVVVVVAVVVLFLLLLKCWYCCGCCG